jgi:hypothetical protein
LIRRRLRHFESIGGTIDCENEERDKKFKNWTNFSKRCIF